MDGDEGDGSNTRGNFFVYDGSRDTPPDVTHVRVAQSVTVIQEYAFRFCRNLKEVELPEGLLKIHAYAFMWCSSLLRIAMPSTVKEVHGCAFRCCESLEEVVLPNKLEWLGVGSFWECKSLRRISIPPAIECIKSSTFCQCCNLTELTLSEGLCEIGDNAFQGCLSLKNLNLPSSLRVVGTGAFYGCTGLTDIMLPDEVNSVRCRAFEDCIFQSLRMPSAVTDIDMGIFEGNNCMVSLELSESVNRIEGDSSLRHSLTYLRNVAIAPECRLDPRIFDECNNLKEIFADKNIATSGNSAAISQALQHRFDGLPIHKLCYYQSYHQAETVMSDLRREINTWSSGPPGSLNATGKQQDSLGMTPLHILACSTKPDLEMVQLLVQKYPETLVMKDKWGAIPMLYAFWCNAPTEVVRFLVESHKSLFPAYDLNWHSTIVTLVKGHVCVSNIQKVLTSQQNNFSDQSCDLESIVMELFKYEWPFSFRISIPTESLLFLLQADISERLDLLDVKRWREGIQGCVNNLPREGDNVYTRDRAIHLRYYYVRTLYAKLASYEMLKEATSLLELALWKARNDESVSIICQRAPQKKAKVGDAAVSSKELCRISCGAGIVLPKVLCYLRPSDWEDEQDYDGSSDESTDSD